MPSNTTLRFATVIATCVALASLSVAWLWPVPPDMAAKGAFAAAAASVLVLAALLWRTASALRDTGSELETVANHAPAAIAHVVRRGDRLNYRFVNTRYAELYGFAARDVIGRQPREILGEAVFAHAYPNMKKAMNGQRVMFDLELAGTGGNPARLVEVTYAPACDRTGKTEGFVGIIRDVTAQRHAEQELRALKSLAASARP